jgi:hypothetical protein
MIPFYPIKNVNKFLADGIKNNLEIINQYRI